MQRKGVLILFRKLQVDLRDSFFFSVVVCFSKKGNTISLCIAKINPAGALHKLGLKTNGGCYSNHLGKSF